MRSKAVVSTVNYLATTWKVISCSRGVDSSGWVVGFSESQRNLRFGSEISEKVVDWGKKADDYKMPNHNYPLRVSHTSKACSLS